MHTRRIRVHRMDRRDEANHADWAQSGQRGVAVCSLHFWLRGCFSKSRLSEDFRIACVAVNEPGFIFSQTRCFDCFVQCIAQRKVASTPFAKKFRL